MSEVLTAVKSLLLVLTGLFPIVNPLGGSPIFLLLTREYSPETRRQLSRRIAINSFFLLIGSYLVGTHVLAFFGISLPVVQVGGGLVVVSTGWTMLKQGEHEEGGRVERGEQKDPLRSAFYPLTMPLTVGPGSISVAITLGANAAHLHRSNPVATIAAVVGCLLLGASVFLCYGFADRLARILGATAMSVIMRLSSFLLVCIGVQIVWNGVSALLATVPLEIR